MTIITVDSNQTLQTALKTAKDGDVIQLASGNYGDVLIRGININGNVTITSADPSKPAVINDLLVKQSSGLTFSHLDFYEDKGGQLNAFTVMSCQNILMDNLTVHGLPNIGSGNESSLMMVRNSQNVTVSNSEFFNGWHGVCMLNNTGLNIVDNSFHDMRTDGVRGGGNSDLMIARNMFTDFYPAAGDHTDAIQIWSTNTTQAAKNITITDNLVVRGDGAPTQGVFVRDTFNTLPFENVTITNNMIAGGLYNAIAVNGVASGTIANNTVAGFPDQKSWIRTENITNMDIKDNKATWYSLNSPNKGTETNNTQIATVTDGGSAYVAEWLAGHQGFASTWYPDLSGVLG